MEHGRADIQVFVPEEKKEIVVDPHQVIRHAVYVLFFAISQLPEYQKCELVLVCRVKTP